MLHSGQGNYYRTSVFPGMVPQTRYPCCHRYMQTGEGFPDIERPAVTELECKNIRESVPFCVEIITYRGIVCRCA